MIQIRAGLPSRNPSAESRPFDLVSYHTDVNGFMLSPQWSGNYDSLTEEQRKVARDCKNFPYNGPFLARDIVADCTRTASFDVPSIRNTCLLEPALGQLHGHVNWVPVTYLGKLNFIDFSADRDIDLHLSEFSPQERSDRLGDYRADGRPETKDPDATRSDLDFRIKPILTSDSQKNPDYINNLQVEFASFELTDLFQSPNDLEGNFWKDLIYIRHRDNRSTEREQRLKAQFKNRTAIVTGLLNLDCVHECHSELHPLYALAVRTKCASPVASEENADPRCLEKGQVAPDRRSVQTNDTWM